MIEEQKLSNISFLKIDKKKMEPIYRSDEARKIWLPQLRQCRRTYWQKHKSCKHLWYLDGKKMDRYIRKCNCLLKKEKQHIPLLPKHFCTLTPRSFNKKRWSGRQPWYHDFTCHMACHYMVSLHFYVVKKLYPKKKMENCFRFSIFMCVGWRI